MGGFTMRYYKLKDGKVLGSFAVPQPDMELTLLEDAPNDESMWDGKAWVADPDKVTARQAEAAKVLAVAEAKTAISTMDAAVEKATDLEGLKKIVLDLIKNVHVLTA
jgi:hypothetical protein